MSKTIRIYNKSNLKKTPRYNLDDGEFHVIHGIPFTKRSCICMGKCPSCRDPNYEPSKIRKRLKERIRKDIIEERTKPLSLNEGVIKALEDNE